MADKISLKIDDKEAWAEVARMKGMKKAQKYALTEWATQTVKHIKQGGLLKTRTGFLKRNVGLAIQEDGELMTAHVGTGVGYAKDVIYAAIQDRGGEIKPRYKKWLTIPAKGVMGTAGNFRGVTKFIPGKRPDTAYLVDKEDYKRGIWTLLFTLKKRVEIPASGWFSLRVDEMEPMLQEVMSADYLYSLIQAGRV